MQRLSAIFAGLLLLMTNAVFAEAAEKRQIDDDVYIRPQKMIEVESGRRLNLYCTGAGSPAVIFESTWASETKIWGLIQPQIAKSNKACSYDRAGIGFSDSSERMANARNIVDDLHRLLKAAEITPPYVMVGGGEGALYVRLYATKFPSEIVGLVLVSPQHENYQEEVRKLHSDHPSAVDWYDVMVEPSLERRRRCAYEAELGDKPADFEERCGFVLHPELGDAIRETLDKMQHEPKFQLAALSEKESLAQVSLDQVRSYQESYGDMPLVVLMQTLRPPAVPIKNPKVSFEALSATVTKLYNDLALKSTRGRLVIKDGDPDGGFYFGRPDAVVAAINDVLADVAEAEKRHADGR